MPVETCGYRDIFIPKFLVHHMWSIWQMQVILQQSQNSNSGSLWCLPLPWMYQSALDQHRWLRNKSQCLVVWTESFHHDKSLWQLWQPKIAYYRGTSPTKGQGNCSLSSGGCCNGVDVLGPRCVQKVSHICNMWLCCYPACEAVSCQSVVILEVIRYKSIMLLDYSAPHHLVFYGIWEVGGRALWGTAYVTLLEYYKPCLIIVSYCIIISSPWQ